MVEEAKPPRIEGDSLIVETVTGTEVYDTQYLVAALLVFVAKGDGNISGPETQRMLSLLEEHFNLQSSATLALLQRAMADIADNPDMRSLLSQLGTLLSPADKEDIILMLLKVVAADGRRDAEEMESLSVAAEIIEIPEEAMHRAYERYFKETGTFDSDPA